MQMVNPHSSQTEKFSVSAVIGTSHSQFADSVVCREVLAHLFQSEVLKPGLDKTSCVDSWCHSHTLLVACCLPPALVLMGSSFQSVFPYSLVRTKPGPVDSRLYLAPAEPPSARWEWSLPHSGKWENQVRVKHIELQLRSTGRSQFSYRALPFLWIKELQRGHCAQPMCQDQAEKQQPQACAGLPVRLGRVWISEWLHVD